MRPLGGARAQGRDRGREGVRRLYPLGSSVDVVVVFSFPYLILRYHLKVRIVSEDHNVHRQVWSRSRWLQQVSVVTYQIGGGGQGKRSQED